MYELLGEVGVETRDLSSKRLGELAGDPSEAGRYATKFEQLGFVKRRLEYGHPSNGMSTGRHYHWTLLVPYDEAKRTLDAVQAVELVEHEKKMSEGNRRSSEKRRGRPQPKKNTMPTESPKRNGQLLDDNGMGVALAKRESEEVRAITGPERPTLADAMPREVLELRRDEAYALVAATRQYVQRADTLRAKIADLERSAADMGVTIDSTKLVNALHFRPDERMEVIRPLLPIIDRLERVVERQVQTIDQLRERLNGYDQLRRDVEKLRKQNERLLAAQVVRSNSAPEPELTRR
jgi:hypothetical protein